MTSSVDPGLCDPPFNIAWDKVKIDMHQLEPQMVAALATLLSDINNLRHRANQLADESVASFPDAEDARALARRYSAVAISLEDAYLSVNNAVGWAK